MSSSKPKRPRACDSCRRRKCNGFDVPPGGRCATCIIHAVECTYNDPPLARNPRRHDQPPPQKVRPKTYVQALEARISNLERLIQHPVHQCELKGTSQPLLSTYDSSVIGDSETEDDTLHPKLGVLLPRAYCQPPDADPLSPSEEADHSDDEFSYPEPDLGEIYAVEDQDRALCSSRGNMLACSMFAFTRQVFGEKEGKRDPVRFMQTRRMEFWDLPDWLIPTLKSAAVQFDFPEMSLMLHLVDSYFDNLDLILPLLHRPSFMRSIAAGFHELDQNFGATVLLVCAVGCRYSDHPSVVHEVSNSTPCTAWSLYNQVNRIRKAPYLPHSLHEVQIYPLSALFLESYSPPETPWLIIGTGLRIMQDSGVHRKFFSKKQSLEKELWKRAFWVSVVLDRAFSTLLGRACVLQDEDFDADLPLVCNDEDLDGSGPNPSTDVNPPTRMCCFVAAIKLNQILAFALRTIYSTRRSRVILGYVGKSWEKHIVATLDSALNKWVDAVPEQLRWGSEVPIKSRSELVQTVFLWTQFYETQLHIHRMFALKEPPDPDLSVSSMIICKNASKQCVAIMESAKDVMTAPLHCFLLIKSLFTSTIFLLLMFWKKKGIDYGSPEFRAIDISTEMVAQTAKRRKTSLHLQDIAGALRATVEGFRTGSKFTISDWSRIKFRGVRYIDQDGILINDGRVGRVESTKDHTSVGVKPPLMTADMIWDGGQEPTATQGVGVGFEEVPTGDRHTTQAMEFFPVNFFADPSVLFFGPSSTGFTGVDDQCIAEEATTYLFRNL